MRLGPKLGEGLSAEVFEWDDNCDGPAKVLKLFNEGRSRQSVERELQFSRAAFEAGVSTPRVYGEIVERDGRVGLVYERVVEQSWMLLLYLLFRPKSYCQTLADLHFKAHAERVSGLQSEKAYLKCKIERARTITKDEKLRLTRLTDAMPDGDRLCHNDFHPYNVIFRTPQKGGPAIIDWEGAGVGDPVADVAGTRWIAMFGWRKFPNGPARWMVRWLLGRFYRHYSERYFELSGVDAARVDRWMTVLAGARIDDEIPGLHDHLVRYLRQRLAAEVYT